jgi:O-antigen/teichoic acid export membrane protein
MRHLALRGMLWTAWGKGAQAALQLLVIAVLARLVSPADFGVVNAVMIVVGFSAIFSRVGLGPALVQRKELRPAHVATAYVASPAIGVAVGLVIWLSAPLVARLFRMEGAEPMLRALALVFPIKGLGVIGESLLERDLRFRLLANLDVASFGVGYGAVGVITALLGWGAWALVAANLGESVVKTIAVMVLRPPPRRLHVERQAFGELLHFGGGFTLGRYFNYIALQGDNLVVGRWLGPVALGLYGRAYQLMANPASLFGDVLDKVLFPTLARVQDEPARLRETYRRGVTLIALIILPSSVILFLLAPELIRLVLGPEWNAVVGPFRILAVGMLFRTSYKMSDAVARATGNVYRRALRQVLYAGLVVGGAIVGQRWGINGVAVAVFVALAANFSAMAELGSRVTGLTKLQLARAHVPALLLAVVALGIALPAATLLRSFTLPAVAIAGVAGIAAVAGCIAAAGIAPSVFLGQDGIWMLSLLRAQLPTRREQAPNVSIEAVRVAG